MPKPRLTLCAGDLDAVHTVLAAKLREAGPGTVKRIEEALGLYRGYIRYNRHHQKLDLGVLLAILQRLNINPDAFFAEVAAPEHADPPTDPDDPPTGPAAAADPTEPELEAEPDAGGYTMDTEAAPDIEPLTARAVLRMVGADLPVYGDFDLSPTGDQREPAAPAGPQVESIAINRTRMWQLEKRKGRPLEALAELADAAADAPVDLHPRLFGASGLAIGRLGLPEAGAEMVRRALELATAAGDHRDGRRLLCHLDAFEELRPPTRLPDPPSRTELEDARNASARVRQAMELPVITATTRAELEELDELRYEHPEATLCRLLPAADRLPPALAVLWLGVTGSTYRLRAGQRQEIEADLRRAYQHLQAALWTAQNAGDVAGLADVLQRLAYVVADRGDHRQALELAERAGGIYDRIGDRAGRGRALVDQGMFLYYLGRTRQAIAAQLQALDLLPDSEQRNRFSTYHSLGTFAAALDDFAAADRYAACAGKLLDAVEPGYAARLLWLRAAIAAQGGAGADAVGLYRKTLDILRTVHYADAALVTVELVRVLILQGRHDEAHHIALTVRQLVIPLQKNHHVSAALVELLRGGQAALDLARVERVRAALEEARTRPDWRIFKVRQA